MASLTTCGSASGLSSCVRTHTPGQGSCLPSTLAFAHQSVLPIELP
eukprot:CAMPEP_0202792208 /NCGR_PEP_ID=MMETSP1388-20130828/83203_1 /ASSEMBLY_ACC=CAM_ASM_000864 /TAXON_ID=37098 /ORGANISM="Isochrysis sp, Strain CCMP1244" /LENGTH=45 /DNA_ID= /DNA_START= /DNA_END= /DNA_ORIENTATION=